MKYLLLCIVILYAGWIISDAIEISSLPEQVRIENNRAQIEKEKELLLNAQREKEFIESLSEKTWLEIYNLPENELAIAINYYFIRLILMALVLGVASISVSKMLTFRDKGHF